MLPSAKEFKDSAGLILMSAKAFAKSLERVEEPFLSCLGAKGIVNYTFFNSGAVPSLDLYVLKLQEALCMPGDSTGAMLLHQYGSMAVTHNVSQNVRLGVCYK